MNIIVLRHLLTYKIYTPDSACQDSIGSNYVYKSSFHSSSNVYNLPQTGATRHGTLIYLYWRALPPRSNITCIVVHQLSSFCLATYIVYKI